MALPNFRVAQTTHGGHPATRGYVPLAGSTFIAGEAVKLDAGTGEVEVAVTALNALGVAQDDALDSAGVLRASVNVALFVAETVFSTVDPNGTAYVKATHEGKAFDFEIAAGSHGVNLGATAGVSFLRVRGLDPTDDARILVSALDLGSEAPGGDAAPV